VNQRKLATTQRRQNIKTIVCAGDERIEMIEAL
jgi:hypothetical protein